MEIPQKKMKVSRATIEMRSKFRVKIFLKDGAPQLQNRQKLAIFVHGSRDIYLDHVMFQPVAVLFHSRSVFGLRRTCLNLLK